MTLIPTQPTGAGEAESRTIALRNARDDIAVRISQLGASIHSIVLATRAGPIDIALGHDSIADYRHSGCYAGAVVGRYAGRIAAGRLRIDGIDHPLRCNSNGDHLHGGITGFNARRWEVIEVTGGSSPSVSLRLHSPHGEEGYPGNLQVVAQYVLSDDALAFSCSAVTDRPTVVNLTQHCYFNLLGHGDCLDHELMLAAREYLPLEASMIPLGTIAPASGPFDFQSFRPIGLAMKNDHRQIALAGGFDHTFVLPEAPGVRHAASVRSRQSGIAMDVLTNQPAIHLYTGNSLEGTPAKGGGAHRRHAGFCLEAQRFPNAPNTAAFPSAILRPDERYVHETVFRFHRPAT